MKFKMKEIFQDGTVRKFNLDEECFYVEENGNKISFNSTYESRFNTLISLFSLKNEWKEYYSEYDECILTFDDKDKMQCFSFSNIFPDNWALLNCYLHNLMGDKYE